MLLYKENGLEVYLFSSFMKMVYEKNRFDTCKTMWNWFEWGTLCIDYNCGRVHLDVRIDFIFLFFSFYIFVSGVHRKEQLQSEKLTFFFCKRNVCELIYQYYRAESMCVYLGKIGNPFWSLEPVCSPSFHTLACLTMCREVWLCCMSKLTCVLEVAILQMFIIFMNLAFSFLTWVLESGLKTAPPTDRPFVICLNQLCWLKVPIFRVMIIIVAHWWQSGVMLVACLSSYDHASISYEMYWMLIILKNGINESLISDPYYLQ